MSVFTNEEKVQILSDVVEIESVNDNEKDVAEYLQKLFNKYDIQSEIISVNDSDW